MAFRSLSRLSSALSAKASTLRSFLLNHPADFSACVYSVTHLVVSCFDTCKNSLEFLSEKVFVFVSQLADLEKLFLQRIIDSFILGCLVSIILID